MSWPVKVKTLPVRKETSDAFPGWIGCLHSGIVTWCWRKHKTTGVLAQRTDEGGPGLCEKFCTYRLFTISCNISLPVKSITRLYLVEVWWNISGVIWFSGEAYGWNPQTWTWHQAYCSCGVLVTEQQEAKNHSLQKKSYRTRKIRAKIKGNHVLKIGTLANLRLTP